MADDKSMEILVVIDRSGSMDSFRHDAIGGFNQFLRSLQEDDAQDDIRRLVTLVTFSQDVTTVYESTPVAEVKPLDEQTYRCGGLTALLDAVGSTIDNAGKRYASWPPDKQPGRVQLVILTDGAENASGTYTSEDVKQRITRQESEYGWDVVFLSSDLSSVNDAKNIGVQCSSIAVTRQSKQGLSASFAAVARRSKLYSAEGVAVKLRSIQQDYDSEVSNRGP